MNTLSSGAGGSSNNNSNNNNSSSSSSSNNNNSGGSSSSSHSSNNNSSNNNNSGNGAPCGNSVGLGVLSSATKKRRKSDTKPLSQINKCLNEKRRREQENVYIEELAELISASIADMSSLSVKPDKCAILQETVNQIKKIKEQEEDGRSSTGDDGVQQGEVSSSKPALLDTQILGTCLLEALDGFLFVVNTEGKVEYVSENVTHFLQYSPDDLVGKSIYNVIHLGDHARFSSSLLPTSIGWPSEVPSQSRSRCFNCRLMVQPPDDKEETMEEKQQRVCRYENMQISAVLQPYPGEKSETGEVGDGAETQHCLVCVARRIPAAEKQLGQSGPLVEQFTTKLDLSGKILAVDTSGVSSTYSQYLNKDLVACIIQELCHPEDLPKLSNHLKEALQTGSSISPIYRLRVTPPCLTSAGDRDKDTVQGNFVYVQTKSKRFPFNQLTHEMEFLMATHSILVDNDVNMLECADKTLPANSNTSSNGNPVLTSVVRNDVISGSSSSLTGLTDTNSLPLPPPSSNFGSYPFSSNELDNFGLDGLFPTSTWDLIPNDSSLDGPPHSGVSLTPNSTNLSQQIPSLNLATGGPLLASQGASSAGSLGDWGSPPARPASNSAIIVPAPPSSLGLLSSRPNSRQSAASTPRPPSVSAFSPAPNSVLGIHPVLSPVTTNPASVQSLASGGGVNAGSQQQPSPASMTAPYSNNFPFSPLQDAPPLGVQTPTTNPGTPFFDDPRDTKDGILSLPMMNNGGVGLINDTGNNGTNTLSSMLSNDSTSSLMESGRLRILLMQRPGSNTVGPATVNHNNSNSNLLLSLGIGDDAMIKREKDVENASCKGNHDNRILKGLLNQDDEEETTLDRMSLSRIPSNQGEPSKILGGNNMLHKLLNERNDDSVEERMGLRKQNELLKKLLKEQDEDPMHQDHTQQEREEQLLKSLGFPSPQQAPAPPTPIVKSPTGSSSTCDNILEFSTNAIRGTKRPSDEGREDVRPSKEPLLNLESLGGNNSIGGGASGGGVLHQLLGPPNNPQPPPSLSGGPGPPGGGCVSSAPSSKLCEKNKMLASLLAKQPMQSSLPATNASPKPSALPQEKLPKDLKEKIMQTPSFAGTSGTHWTGGTVQAQQTPPTTQSNLTQRHPALQIMHQQPLQRSQSVHQQSQHQSPQVPTTPQTGFLNSLLNRPIDNSSPLTNHNEQQNMFLSSQQSQPQAQQSQQLQHPQNNLSINTGSARSAIPGPKLVISNQQVSVSAAVNPSGGFNITLNQSTVNVGLDRTLGSSGLQRPVAGVAAQNRTFISNDDFLTEALSSGWDVQSTDPLLSDILDQVIEMDTNYETTISSASDDAAFLNIFDELTSPPSVVPPPIPQQAPIIQQDITEKLAITAIQKSLMSFEDAAPAAPSPPAYNISYGQPQGGLRPPAPPYGLNNAGGNSNMTNQQLLLQRKQKFMAQQHQQQQRRLLARQQSQPAMLGVQLNDPVQHAPGAQLSPGALQNMDELLNSIPPNMTISRSGVMADSQVSPSYGAGMLNSPLGGAPGNGSQVSPGQRSMQPPFSPHGPIGSSYNPPVTGVNNFGSGGPGPGQARLSPHGNMPPFSSAQVSPRLGQPSQSFTSTQLSPQSVVGTRASPGINLVNNHPGQPSPNAGWNNNMPNRPNLQNQQQGQQQQQQQQQHLNFVPNPRGYSPMARPSLRSLPSPGPPNPGSATAARSSNFTGMPDGSGANLGATPPTSTGGLFIHHSQQQLRLQRTVSAPSGVIPAMVGGANSTRQMGPGREQSSPLHPNAPSTLIHHPPKSYPSPAYPLGLSNSSQSYTSNRASYSAKMLAFQHPPSLLPRLPSMGSSQPSPSPMSCPPSSEEAASFFNFDSVSANSLVPPGPAPSTELQTAGSGPGSGNPTGGTSGMSSEYVRKELRAVVGARANQGLGGIGMGGPVLNMNQSLNQSVMNNNTPPMVPGGQPLNQSDLEALGLSLELPQGNEVTNGRLWDSPTLGESPSQTMPTTRNSVDEPTRSSDPKMSMSLLQKLLSE